MSVSERTRAYSAINANPAAEALPNIRAPGWRGCTRKTTTTSGIIQARPKEIMGYLAKGPTKIDPRAYLQSKNQDRA
tara:strand:+ start:360 stop:590 length:231 start_codon:yes stop_codon:yes gene_type:complete